MYLPCAKMEYDGFTLDDTDADVGPLLGIIVCHNLKWSLDDREGNISTTPSLKLLLRAAAEDRTDLLLGDFHPAQVRWAVDSGLGPLLRHVTSRDPRARETPLWPLIESADLTARVMTSERLGAVDEMIRVCAGRTKPFTLLKGISICEQFYPKPHLRPMGDIDVLTEPDDAAIVEACLLELGYRRTSSYPPEFYQTHHHLIPLFHGRTQVWVEIHRGLFPDNSRLGSERAFDFANVAAERRQSTFRNCPVNRLSDELQVLYIAAHWAFGLRRVGGIVGMLDLIYLFARRTHALRWERIFEWLDGSLATTYVYVLLSYLSRYRLIALTPQVLRELFARQRSFGRTNLMVLHTLLDRYVTEGREFGALVSERNFALLWRGLERPGSPLGNVRRALWSLRPSRAWLSRSLSQTDYTPPT